MASSLDIYVGADHAGFALKEQVVDRLKKNFPNLRFVDCGTFNDERTDYPRYAMLVAEKVRTESARGILLCGSGIGMSIVANKLKGIRAAVAWDVTSARLSRAHNDANILCLGSRLIGPEVVYEICSVWLNTQFEGGRHKDRLSLISELEGGQHTCTNLKK